METRILAQLVVSLLVCTAVVGATPAAGANAGDAAAPAWPPGTLVAKPSRASDP